MTIHPSRGSRINPTLKVCEHNRAAHASGVIPVAVSLWGAKSLRGAPKRPNNVTSTFFSMVHLLLKKLKFEHGGAKLQTCLLSRCQAKFLTCEISDFTPCTHAQSNILYIKYADIIYY